MTELVLEKREDTEAFGEAIGRSAPGGLVIAFRGDLGAGKTVMAKGIGRGLGIEDEVTSPTFTVLSEYEGRLRLHHMDAYRLLGPEDFAELGGEEILADPDGLSLIEWSERIGEILPSSAESIELRVRPDGSRLASIQGRILESIALGFSARTAGDEPAPGRNTPLHDHAPGEDGR